MMGEMGIQKGWAPASHVRQGAILKEMGRLSHPEHPQRDAFIQAIGSRQDYVSVLAHFLESVTCEEEGHLRRDWFPPEGPSGYFPMEAGKDLEETVRQGTLSALLKAVEHGVPVEFFWIIPVKSYNVTFPVFVEHQVTSTAVIAFRVTPLYTGAIEEPVASPSLQ